MGKLFCLVMWMGGLCCLSGSVLALEAVVQSGVGAGSAVAGSIGAVNARADAIGANVTAVNLIVQQQGEQIKELQTQMSQTLELVREITGGTVTRETRNTEVVERIISCNAQGMLWDGTRCAEISSTVPKGSWCGYRWGWWSQGGTRGVAPRATYDRDAWNEHYMQNFGTQAPASVSEFSSNIPCQGQVLTHVLVDGFWRVNCPSGYVGYRDNNSDMNGAPSLLTCVKK